MEGDTAPKNEDPEFISAGIGLVVSTVQTYGWLVFGVVVVGAYLASRLRPQFENWRQRQADGAFKKTDVNAAASRMEAMERARQRMQGELDTLSKEHMKKQAVKEEQKRQERLEDWDRHVEGRGYRSKVKPTESQGEASSKLGKAKKTLRTDYNPLMGDNSGSGFRPTRRGGASGGG